METGAISAWTVKEGDHVGAGDVIATIETDKASVDYEMQDEGYIAKILYADGTKDIPVGAPICILVEEEEDIAKFKDFSLGDVAAPAAASTPKVEKAAEPQAATPSSQPTQPAQPEKGGRVVASPLAHKLAAEQGISLNSLTGTGPNHRIIGADVLEAQAIPAPAKSAQAASPASLFEYEDTAVSGIRKVIAKRLTESKQTVPHYYVTVAVEVDALLKMRATLNQHATSKISVNDMVIKAAALASVQVPQTNSSWQGDSIREFKNVNMSVAIQTDSGLVAPNVKAANLKGLEQISREVKALAAKARENKLSLEDLNDGTFTVSNLGMFGVSNFQAIIMPPQACILAVSAAEKRVVPAEGEDQYKVVHAMNVTLSSDHRVVDGAIAAEWGLAFKKYVESPELMLL